MGKFRILIKGIVRHDGKYLAVERWYDDRIFEPYQWEFIDGEMEFERYQTKHWNALWQRKQDFLLCRIRFCIHGDLRQGRPVQ